MRCPFCSATEDKVVDTRPSDNEQIIRRRRECVGCSRRFTTYERIEEVLPLVIKKDGRREPYDRAKLMGGLKRACAKRPVPMERLEKILDEVERGLQELGEKEVPSSKIGDAVLAKLRETDEVAYVRFASVYLSFRDAGELMNEVQRLVLSKGER
jgi:transcriptional repressor NrdR